MRIIIAPDKFKDACSATEVCTYLTKGLRKILPASVPILSLPLADGGEGTLDALAAITPLHFEYIQTQDALGRPISAKYARLQTGNCAVIEMAQASGIQQLAPHERSATLSSSFGTGLLLRDALDKGCKRIFLTVGGTATNDGGMGIAKALGIRFLDKNGQELEPIGQNLSRVENIDTSSLCFDPTTIQLEIATDVSNPLFGLNGAACVYAAQKGASIHQIAELDDGLQHFCTILTKEGYPSPAFLAGSGAGGGVAASLVPLLHATICSATDWLLGYYELESKIQKGDILITGEGKVDRQTWEGKLICALTRVATQSNMPVCIICGTLEDLDSIPKTFPLKYLSSIIHRPLSLQEALTQTPLLLEEQGIILGHLLTSQQS